MNAVDKMVLSEQIASIMNARFTGRPTKQESEEILKIAEDLYQNHIDDSMPGELSKPSLIFAKHKEATNE